MNKTHKKIIKNIMPPLFVNIYKTSFSKYGWFGNYRTWEDAKKKSIGYDSDLILRKVKDSLLKVKKGEAVYERDSVLFNKIEYSETILAALILIQKNKKINVIDFGGSLGSTYYQNKKFLDLFRDVKWNIVEQKNFVNYGKKYFEDNKLKFYETIEDCKQESNAIIFSNVIQYIEKPYELLKKILEKKFEYIIFDKIPIIKGKDRITIQKVSPQIYKASYPCWFFNEDKFKRFLNRKYKLIEEFQNKDVANIPSEFKGFIFKRK